MVDLSQDVFSFFTSNCKCTPSQEERLPLVPFVGQEDTFLGDSQLPSLEAIVDASCDNPHEMEGFESERRCSGGFVAGDADVVGVENLGFQGDGNCGEESEIGPQLKKSRVIPMVHCSGKVLIDGADDGDKMVVFSGDLKVEVASSSKNVDPEGGGCTEKLDFEGVEDSKSVVPEGGGCTEKLDTEGIEDDGGVEVEVDVRGECGLKNDLTTEVIELEEEEIEEKCNDDKDNGEGHGEGGGKVGEEEGGRTRMKRELPPSMFGLIWGQGSGDGKRDESSKSSEDDGMKCILEVLRVLASEECPDDNNEVDIFETAKRRGMTFPCSRFLVEVEEDE